MFLKSRPFVFKQPVVTLSKDYKTVKKINITSVSKIKNRIRNRIRNAVTTVKLGKSKRNLYKYSYFYRQFHSYNDFIYRRTMALRKTQHFDYLKAERTHLKMNEKRAYRLRRRRRLIRFSYGIVYVTHRRRNTFITIFKLSPQGNKRILYKTSVGLVGYNGPKRKTMLGKEHVAKIANSFLYRKRFTTVDLVFTTKIGRWFGSLIRCLIPRFLYLRRIYIPRKRSHGYMRLRKQKRL